MILVAGATGFIGRALLPRLHEEAAAGGIATAALVRREFDAVRLRERGVEARTADLSSGRGLDAAMRGVRTLVYLAHTPDRPGDVVANDLEAVQNALLAARRAGAERVVLLGSIAASETSTTPYLLGRWAVELAIHQSGLRWVVLRAPLVVGATPPHHPGTPFELLRRFVDHQPVVALRAWRRTPVEPVALADVVEALTIAALTDELDGRSLDIAGPERMTMTQALRGWARVRGRRRLWLPVPGSGAWETALAASTIGGLPRRRTRLLLDTFAAPQVCSDPSRRFPLGHRPLPYRDALRAALPAAHRAETPPPEFPPAA